MNILPIILLALIASFLIFAIGFAIGVISLSEAIKQDLPNTKASLNRYIKSNKGVVSVHDDNKTALIPILLLEYEKGNYYLFEQKTNAFWGQATTLEELAEFVNQYKKTSLACVLQKENELLTPLWFIDGKVEILNPNEG